MLVSFLRPENSAVLKSIFFSTEVLVEGEVQKNIFAQRKIKWKKIMHAN